MSDVDRLFEALGRKARRVQLASAFAVALPIASGGLILVTFALQLFRFPWALAVGYGPAAAAAAALAAAGWAVLVGLRPLHLPRLLYALDTQIESGARLSSLYELRRSGGSRVFERALAPLVEARAEEYVERIRVGRGHRFAIVLGLIVLGVLICSPWIAGALRSGDAHDAIEVETAGTIVAPTEQESSAAPEASAAREDQSDSASDEGLVLDDVLKSLRTSRSGEEQQVDELSAFDEAEDRARRGAPSLTETLTEISERMRSTGSGALTDAERGAISKIQSEAPPPVASELEGLLDETDPEATEARIERLLESGTAFPESEMDESTSAMDADGGDLETGSSTAADGSPGEGAESAASTATDGLEGGSGEGEAAQTGEDDAPSYPISDVEDAEGGGPDLVEAGLPSRFGERGEIIEYITKGVPIEPPAESSAESASFVVDFERMRSILDDRPIPTDAYEIVKRYFETISEGGP